jgi:hypothetical protein
MLLSSHENLMDDHIILNIAHEVVVENLKFQQPQSCTCIQIETILHVLMLVVRRQANLPLI